MLLEEIAQLEEIIENLQEATTMKNVSEIYDYSSQAQALYGGEIPQIEDAFDQMCHQSGLVLRSAKTIIQLLNRYLIKCKHLLNADSSSGKIPMTANEFEEQLYRVMKVVLAIPDAEPRVIAEKSGIALPKLYETLLVIKEEHLLEGVNIQAGCYGADYRAARPTMTGLQFMKRFEKDGIPTLNGDGKPTVFVSYNQKSATSFVDTLESRLSSCARVVRDISSLSSWDSFTEFMKTIRKQDFVVLVITEEYLYSTACMFEVSELLKDDEWKNKVMFAVLYDKIYSDSVPDYIHYWQEKEKEKTKEAEGVELVNMGPIAEEIKRIRAIQGCVGDFLEVVRDRNNPKPWEVIDKIIDRIKHENYADFTLALDNGPYAEAWQHQVNKALGLE